VVTLDTASRLEVRFDGTERRAVLLGQGWFKIAPGASPFRIEAGGRNLSAKGGEFDVRTDPGNVRAYAAAGRLMLDNGDNPVVVDAGRLMEIRDGAAMVRSVQDPAPLTGWRAGLLQFRDAPVGEVAGELNRYRRHPIEMADGRVAAMRISGTFRTAEGSAFPDALASGFPVRVSTGSDERVVVASR
jgi:transmembrane sensor